MIDRKAIHAMLLIRNRQDSIFNQLGSEYRLPTDVIKLIANAGFDPDPNSDIGNLLQNIVLGNLNAVKAMLDTKPNLIGKVGHVVTPSGLVVRYVKPYECSLGAGDPEMARLIASYFNIFTDGAEQKTTQDKKYVPYLEALQAQLESNQPAYNAAPLIQQIIKAPDEEVIAALEKSEDLTIPLCNALKNFRDAVRPQQSQTVGLHYQHYTTVLQVLALIEDNFLLLSKYRRDFSKFNLAWEQVLGYLSRSFSFLERSALARAFQDNERTLVCIYKNEIKFPEKSDASTEGYGLGFDYSICGGYGSISVNECRKSFRKNISDKISSLLHLCNQTPRPNESSSPTPHN